MIKDIYSPNNWSLYKMDFNGKDIKIIADFKDKLVDVSFSYDYEETNILDLQDAFDLIINQNDDESYWLSCGEDNYELSTTEDVNGDMVLNKIKDMSVTDFITLLSKLNK